MPGIILLNPVTGTVNLSEPITGTVGLSGPITGAVKLTEAPQIASGSVTGLLVGGQPVSFANPIPITGSISVAPPAVQNVTGSAWTPQVVITGSIPLTGTFGLSGPITGAVKLTEAPQIASGSITGLLVGGQPVSTINPVPITGSISVTAPAVQNVTGSAWTPTITGSVVVANQVNVTGTVGITGPITGAVKLTEAPQIASGSITGLLVGGQPVSSTNPVPITGSISVTPPVVQNVTGSAWTPTITGSVVVANQVNITGTVGLSGPITGTVGLSGPITGAVKLTEPVAVSNFPAGFNVAITASVALTASVTGTVGISGPVTGAFKITEAVKTASGSLVGILLGGVDVSAANPVPVTGTIGIVGTVTISGSSNVSGTVVVNGPGLASSRAGFCFGKMDTSVGGEQIIEHTLYTEMTGNFKLSLSSASGTDTVAAGGTGARLVKVTWYDVTGSGPFTETVQMSGTTNVPLSASSTCYIEKMEVLTVGSYTTNKGTISLKIGATGAGATVGSILGNHGRTYWAHHYVPSGTTCFITGMYGAHFNNTSAGSGGTFFIRYKDFSRTDSANVQLTDYLNAYGQSSAPVRVYGTPIRVIGPARLSMFVYPDGALTETFVGSFDFYEQDNA